MKNYIGMKWNELTVREQKKLLRRAKINNDSIDKKKGEYIINLTNTLSVGGLILKPKGRAYRLTDTLPVEGQRICEDDEEIFFVNPDGVIYNHCEGKVERSTPQEK